MRIGRKWHAGLGIRLLFFHGLDAAGIGFFQKGEALSGTCKGTQNEDAAATGSVAGTKLTLAYDTTYQGSAVHLAYAGDVQSDGTAKGTVDTGGPAGTFTLTK